MSRAEDLFEELKSGGKETLLSWIRKEKRAEDQFLEYKQCESLQKPGDFSNRDQEKLSKALSGFSNTTGGILVWGVECKQIDGREVPSKPKPIKEIKKFKSRVDRLISALTYPALESVETHSIDTRENGEGFLVVLVPRSNYVPIRAARQEQYFIRSTSSTVVMPHDTLALYFGRRPEPLIRPQLIRQEPVQSGRIALQLSRFIKFRNEGTTILKDFYIICKVKQHIGPRCRVEYQELAARYMNRVSSESHVESFIANNDLKIVPSDSIVALNVIVTLKAPFEKDFELDIYYGCEGGKQEKFTFKKDKAFFGNVSQKFFDPVNLNTTTDEEFQGHKLLTKDTLKDFDNKLFDTLPNIEHAN